jgi:hypothetical protein
MCGIRLGCRPGETCGVASGGVKLQCLSDPDAAVDAGPPTCTTSDECAPLATCTGGICCAGEVRDGRCRCGLSDGCVGGAVCCVATWSADGKTPTCVPDSLSCK